MKRHPKAAAVPVADRPPDDAQSVVDQSRDAAKLIFDRLHAHNAAEASAKTLLARKVGVKRAKARRQ